ncbi:hypothetical protein ABEB36_015525 [Hypothenemus hampei]|uniref:Uncharacterized protein n=1 Tax=Hypothenemus hampei TaxID=57062 RepID=A0ABD1DZM7_HYPHA
MRRYFLYMSDEEEQFTVQGADPPVPVGGAVPAQAAADRQPATETNTPPVVDPKAAGSGSDTGRRGSGADPEELCTKGSLGKFWSYGAAKEDVAESDVEAATSAMDTLPEAGKRTRGESTSPEERQLSKKQKKERSSSKDAVRSDEETGRSLGKLGKYGT